MSMAEICVWQTLISSFSLCFVADPQCKTLATNITTKYKSKNTDDQMQTKTSRLSTLLEYSE